MTRSESDSASGDVLQHNPENPYRMKSNGNYWSRAALVVAHPSHELRVHGWMQTARPHVFVLTDGSGRISEARLQSTTRVLEEVGARPASIYGRMKDLDVYNALIKLDFPFFIQLAEELAEEFERQQIECVVGDSDEGYSSTHDACRLVVDAAVEMVRRRSQRQLINFDFAVVGPPDECPDSPCNETIRIQLNDKAFARKVAAARGYSPKLALDVEAALRGEPFKGVRRFSEPQLTGEIDKELTTELLSALRAYPALERKVKDILGGTELDRFRTECLRPVRPRTNKLSQAKSVSTNFTERSWLLPVTIRSPSVMPTTFCPSRRPCGATSEPARS